MIPRYRYLVPIRFASSNPVLRLHPDSAGGGSEQDVTIPITALRDYWVAGDGETVTIGHEDLLAVVKQGLDSNTDGQRYVVELDPATHVITIRSEDGNEFDVLVTHANTTFDVTLLGFDAALDLAGSETHTAPYQAKGVFLPEQEVLRDTGDEPVVIGTVVQSSQASRASEDDVIYERDVDYHLVQRHRIKDDHAEASKPYGSFEYVWLNENLARGCDVRVYDRDDFRSPSAFKTYRLRDFRRPWKIQDDTSQLFYRLALRLTREASGAARTISPNKSVFFDGVNDLLRMPDHSSLQFTSGFALSFWTYRTAAWADGQTLLAKWLPNTQNAWRIHTAGGHIRCYVADDVTDSGANYGGFSYAGLATNLWDHHFVHVDCAQGTNPTRLRWWLNGAEQTLTFGGTIPPALTAATSDVTWGTDHAAAGNWWAGNLANVILYRAALADPAAEAARVYGKKTPPDPTRVSLWLASGCSWWNTGTQDTAPAILDHGGLQYNHGTLLSGAGISALYPSPATAA